MGWFDERSRHGGVDEMPLPRVPGRLWLAGKHLVAPDPDALLAHLDAHLVVCLSQRAELAERYPAYVDWLVANRPTRALWWPVPDLHAPSLDEAEVLLGTLLDRLGAGDGVVVHCGAGIGRAGTVAAAVLVSLGVELPAALATVRAHRPMGGPEAGAQRELLEALAAVPRC